MKTDFNLIFVFNTENGIFHPASDIAQKIITPYAERCNLRKLTYTPHGEKLEWNNYIKQLGIPFQYLFKDEFTTLYPQEEEGFPAIYACSGSKLTLLMDDFMIYTCETLEDLKLMLKNEIQLYRNQVEQKRSC